MDDTGKRYKQKRWRTKHGIQADIEWKVGDLFCCPFCSAEITISPMLFDLASTSRLVIPPERVDSVEPGNLYVRRKTYGKEFVRHLRSRPDKMCEGYHQDHPKRQPSPGAEMLRRDRELSEQIEILRAELEVRLGREEAERVEQDEQEEQTDQAQGRGMRSPRRYYMSGARQDMPCSETTAEPILRKHVRFSPDESEEVDDDRCRCAAYHEPHYHLPARRPSPQPQRHRHRQRVPRPCLTPLPDEYYTQDIFPDDTCDCSRHHRHHRRERQENDEFPLFVQRVFFGRGRRRKGGECRRVSRQYCYVDRTPEDY